MMHAVELRNVTVEHRGGKRALQHVSLSVAQGEFLTIVGPSGCGKSTLLRVVAGLVPPSDGDVLLDGAEVNHVEPGGRDVAFVFQSYALYPHMTVAKNLAFPLRMRKVARAEREVRVAEVAARLGIEDLLGRRPAQLSGGQMQRVALGRALVRRPRVFLLDEPLSNLDPRLRDDVRSELRRLHAELGVTTLYVTHDQAEAVTLGERVCVLGDGRVHQIGAPLEVHASPASTFVADLFGAPPMNLVRGRVDAGTFSRGRLRMSADEVADRAEVVLGLRPEELRLAPAGVRSTVVDVERTGDRTLLRVDIGDDAALRVVLAGDVPALVGDAVHVDLGRARAHWFGPGASGARLTDDSRLEPDA